MQTVGANNKVEPPSTATFELNLHAICLFLKTNNFIAENCLGVAFDFLE